MGDWLCTSFGTRRAWSPTVLIKSFQHSRRAVRVLIGEPQVVVRTQVQAPPNLPCALQRPALPCPTALQPVLLASSDHASQQAVANAIGTPMTQ